ncbi:unnamed protein product [Rotaria sp. Silwood2]|nr:unnamed protein product [Rotaria sp. Silwood2]
MSCRWRGFFAYLTITGIIYSFLIQAISRSFLIVLVHKYRWIVSFKAHYVLLCIQWTVVLLLNLPSIFTKDIQFRPHALCWITQSTPIHNMYTYIAYYAIPTAFIIIIYASVYCQVRHSTTEAFTRQGRHRQQNRDFEVFRNIMILFGIYLCGGIPTTIYMHLNIDIFYWIGIVAVSMTVAVEKFVTFYLDRELLNVLKKRICQKTTRVVPVIS